MQALVKHYDEAYLALLRKTHVDVAISLETYIDHLTSELETFETAHPGIVVLFKQASAAMFKDFDVSDEQDIEILVSYYRKRNPKLKAKAERVARMVLAVMDGVTLRTLDKDTQNLKNEARTLLLAYLKLYFE